MRKQDKTEKVIANIYCVYGEGGGLELLNKKAICSTISVCRIVAIEE